MINSKLVPGFQFSYYSKSFTVIGLQCKQDGWYCIIKDQHGKLFSNTTEATERMMTLPSKLVKVTDNRNSVTVISNITIIEVNKPNSHK
jgi:hypothetical protein